MTTLLLIRHGETEWNLEGKYTGHADIPLNETGRIQAKEVAQTVAQGAIDAIFSSDLMRALETAAIVAGKCQEDRRADGHAVGQKTLFRST